MSKYVCDVCNKEFTSKQRLAYHYVNKVCNEKTYKCKYCKNLFSSKSTMYRHMRNSCKIKKEDEQEKEMIYERLIKLEESNKQIESLKIENAKLKQEMNTIHKTPVSMITNTINKATMNINNGTINNITLVAYGTEDFSKIDTLDILRALRTGYNSPLKLTETVHFNPKYPEYHNIYITNMKDKYAMMYDGQNWTLTIKDDLINKLYEDKKNYIEENLEDFLNSLTMSQRRALDRWLETDEEDKKIRDIKEKIKLLLYNSKHIPINTQNIAGLINDDVKIIDCTKRPKINRLK